MKQIIDISVQILQGNDFIIQATDCPIRSKRSRALTHLDKPPSRARYNHQ